MSTAIDQVEQAERTERKIPAAATRFDAAALFQFAEAEEGTAGRPVRLHARDAKPIAHWYWGKIAHDMAGVIHKDRLAIDWCHDSEQILGYVDQVTADTTKGLDLAGAILTDLDEKAAEVAAKADAGVPYESSIDWTGPAILEYVEAGMKATVNGYTFEGPGYIARQWHLRGVAICPHGADMSTTTEFAAGGEVGVTVFSNKGGVTMPTTQSQPATTDNAQAEVISREIASSTAVPQDAGKQERAILGQRFMQAFGEDLGAKLFTKGLSFEDATVEHSKQLTAANASLEAEVKQLKAQVATLRSQMGQSEPATFTPEGAKPTQEQAPVGTDNARRFAAAITLPKLPKTK